jgi:transmembrane sensor
MQANDDYILLLSKQFSGDISPREFEMLQSWLAQSPEHEQLATELRQVWDRTAGFSKNISPDLDVAFQQVQAKIRADMQPRAKVVTFSRQLVRIAAALVLLLSGFWAYRQFSPPASMKVFAAKADKQFFQLPDGSRVWLRNNGTLEYPVEFEGKERHVRLLGEAYFEVEHDPAHPFIVDLPNGDVVKVLGTAFGVHNAQGQGRIDVLVRTGQVLFSPKRQPKGVVLTSHQKATYDLAESRIIIDKDATLNELAWQTGGLEFIGTPMEKVIADIESHYKVKINLRNITMRTCPHTALHTTQPIDEVLESLALAYQFRVTHSAPGQYELAGGTCR